MQYKYHNIIFDLDGTLINSGPGIIHAVQYALKKYGINETNMTVLKSFVGPPLNQQFINCYNFNHEQSLEAVKYFREYYTDKGIFDLVLAFDKLLKEYENVKLFLIGPDEENIENQICEFLKSKNVIRIETRCRNYYCH